MAAKDLITVCRQLGFEWEQLGVVIVDHGSRREQSNRALHDIVRLFQQSTEYRLVAAAHMELAEPTVEQAFDRLVSQGAQFIVVHPYFLSPGRHWAEDIPALAQAAAEKHADIGYLVTAPLGVHELMAEIMHTRIHDCLTKAASPRSHPGAVHPGH